MKARNAISNINLIIERMQASFPSMYHVYDKKTILYALLSVFGSRYGMRTDVIDRLYAMIGIDSTYDEDLEHRWGSLLGVYKQASESFDDYRGRLKIVYSSLSGGTAESIKYAIASAAGIESDENVINNYVHVYDAWEYPYTIDPLLLGLDEIVDETSLYGSIICTIDVAGVNGIIEHDKIINTINQTKASGINPCLLLLYNAEESASLLRDNDTFKNDIKYIPDDYIGVDADDSISSMKIKDNIPSESVSIGGISTGTWSSVGTNSAVLNVSLVTNMYTEADEHTDVILNTAVLGKAVLGLAVMGVDV